MKKIRKQVSGIVKLCISICMLIMLIPIHNANALDVDKQIDDELKVAIISGDGTADNPYVVNYNKAPHFKNYMETLDEKIISSLHGNVPTTRGIFDGVLVGTAHTNQSRGGYWVYKSGAPSTSVNGNIWMKAVTYQSVSDTKALYKLRNDEYQWNKIEEIGSAIASRSAEQAYDLIVSSGIAGTTATSLLRAVGKINGVFTAVTVLQFINDYCVLSRYRTAANNGDGMLHATYNTSYNGSWYSHSLEDIWSTANTAYEPAAYYGKGTYRSF